MKIWWICLKYKVNLIQNFSHQVTDPQPPLLSQIDLRLLGTATYLDKLTTLPSSCLCLPSVTSGGLVAISTQGKLVTIHLIALWFNSGDDESRILFKVYEINLK